MSLSPDPNSPTATCDGVSLHSLPGPPAEKRQRITARACFLGMVASIGGFMFGYASGQIAGFFGMDDFARRFGEPDGTTGEYKFGAARQGIIVAALCIGALLGSLAAGPLADGLGRRRTISAAALWSCVGTAIELSAAASWGQFASGRLVTGAGIGALSVVVPMYQSESAPPAFRGLLVSSYQLLVTLGIWAAELANYAARNLPGSAAWRLPDGLGLAWALALAAGVLLLPESPRHACRRGRPDEARATMAALAGLDRRDPAVSRQLAEIEAKLAEERDEAPRAKPRSTWAAMLARGPGRVLYRTVLGAALQAGQQLTGANFFFYYGTTVFGASGLGDAYATQLVLGSVNVACTFAGLYVAARCSRRRALMAGAACMAACFLVFALVGHFALGPPPGTRAPADGPGPRAAGCVLVAVSCLFVATFASTWGPLVWTVVAELYPARLRAPCMAVATASNWLCNAAISLSTRFVVDAIGYLYGLVFAACCAALVVIVYLFVIESKDRSLEEIDALYVAGVNPRTSSAAQPVAGGGVAEEEKGEAEEASCKA